MHRDECDAHESSRRTSRVTHDSAGDDSQHHPTKKTADRLMHRPEVDAAVSAWAESMPPRQAAATLQEVGVPAGFMQRVHAYPDDPQLVAREFLASMDQAGLSEPRLVERYLCPSYGPGEPELRSAPLAFEHTRELCREWLGMGDEEIDMAPGSPVQSPVRTLPLA
jgi:crotonobetainyl-CoA:carnitine CoA-transferase CaiB-like acyl-CoA transferase